MARRAMADQPNILLMVFDTARRDRFGCYGYARGTTPAVDDFARRALVFDRMITPAPWTVPSHASLFTGLYPREHGADHPLPILNGAVPTLASFFRDRGYTTVCVTNNPLVHHETGLSAGFSQVILRPGGASAPWLSRGRVVLGLQDSGAAATNRVVGGLLRRLPQPFLLFINYLECHWQYTPPRRFERRFTSEDTLVRSMHRRVRQRSQVMWEAVATADEARLRLYRDLYDAEMACLDERTGHLLATIERAGLLEQSIIVLTSDHGENIGEEGLASHQGSLRQNLIHVPFLVRVPGRPAGRIPGLVQFTDVFRGLCGLADVRVPPHLDDRPMSVDPFRLSSGELGRPVAFAEWRHWGTEKLTRIQRKAPHFDFRRIPHGLESAQDARYKLVVDLGTGTQRLYDLVEDPAESLDVAQQHPADLTRLRDALQQWRDTARQPVTAAGYSPQDLVAVEHRLQELGYL